MNLELNSSGESVLLHLVTLPPGPGEVSRTTWGMQNLVKLINIDA